MNELEKCMAGKYYNCHDRVFLEFKTRARDLLQEYNTLAYEQNRRGLRHRSRKRGYKRCASGFAGSGEFLPGDS